MRGVIQVAFLPLSPGPVEIGGGMDGVVRGALPPGM